MWAGDSPLTTLSFLEVDTPVPALAQGAILVQDPLVRDPDLRE